MPSKVPVDRWEGVDGRQFIGQAYPTYALLDSSLLKRADETGLMLCSVSVSFGSNYQIPVLIRRCKSGVTCAVTSTHITINLESLSKPGDFTMGDSKFLGYFQLGTTTFHSYNNSTT
ncbi:uncharacterized protein TNCV_2577211 [Trichonephila clavipes]|nr:uncharacterized protein TNCV_2577211 [Trichonephila clavipes]